MRSGSWPGAQSTWTTRVTVNGVVRPTLKGGVTVRQGMVDGHPAADSGASWCTEATIQWANPSAVSALSPQPFTGDSWVPREGDDVVVETGDGVLDLWWVQHRGVIDRTSGSLRDGTATSTTVDRIEDLASTAHYSALLSGMVPVNDGEEWRRVGLSSAWLVDKMLREMNQLGWYATPPRTPQTVASMTGNGSAWPEIGKCLSAHKYGDTSQGPSWVKTPYGTAPVNYVASTELTAMTSQPVVSCYLGGAYTGSSTGTIKVIDGDNIGCFIGLDTATDEVLYGATSGSTITYRVARDGATRAAISFKRDGSSSTELVLHLDDDREITRAPALSLPPGWAATRVDVSSRAVIGWWMVEKSPPSPWATIGRAPTARLRIGDHQWWAASRDLQGVNRAEWLREQVEAECAAMWLDADGVMQWAGRGVLDSQPSAQTVTTDIDVEDIVWQSSRRALAREVRISYLKANIRAASDGSIRRDCWTSNSVDVGAGETDDFIVSTPSEEDWVGVDTGPKHVNGGTLAWQHRFGSTYGGTQYRSSDSEDQAWAAFIDCTMARVSLRDFRITFGGWPSMPSSHRIKSEYPDDGGGGLTSMNSEGALRLRCRAINAWTDGDWSSPAGVNGRAIYEHDASWRVQTVGSSDSLGELMLMLKGALALPPLTLTGLQVSHDPRREIGDVITVQDRHRSGAWVSVIVQDRETDGATDRIGGRVIAHGKIAGLPLTEAPGPAPTTPVTDPTRRVA